MIPFRNDYTAVQLGHVILDRLIRYYGILKSIISDRDKLFTLNYQTTLLAAIRTKRKLLTAYHLQTDKQTKRTNYTIKTFLWIYSNQQQNNQVLLLPIAQLAYNNKLNKTTRQTLFFTNYRKHLNLFTQTFLSKKKN